MSHSTILLDDALTPGGTLVTTADWAYHYCKARVPVVVLYGVAGPGVCRCRRGRDCENRGKHPRGGEGWQARAMALDAEAARRWYVEHPNDNMGLLMGCERNWIGIDADQDRGGLESLARLVTEFGLTDTLEYETGGGGRHRIYCDPTGTIPNLKKLPDYAGIEIMARGLYLVTHPSWHELGRQYGRPKSLAVAQVAPKLRTYLVSLRSDRSAVKTTEPAEGKSLFRVPAGRRHEAILREASRLHAKGLIKEEAEPIIRQMAQVSDYCETEATRVLNDVYNRYEEGAPTLAEQIHRTDLGNARRLVQRHGRDLRHVASMGWLHWPGTHWTRDETGEVYRRAKETVAAIYTEAASEPDERERKALVAHALRSEAERAIRAMVNLAASEEPVAVRSEDLDQDHWLLNCANGTLDLRNGDLREHRREDLITRVCPVTYDSRAACPRWIEFLFRIMRGNKELVAFLQRVVGYCLTASTREQVFFYLFGLGANGKSTFIRTLQTLLGDYACQAAPDLLVSKIGERHSTEIADLRGKRLVASIEVDEGRKLAEALVKQLTGGDKLKARFMRQDNFEFDATFKLFLVANHKLQVRGTDDAIWRRVRLIPFLVRIGDQEKDPDLKETLCEHELPGILAWAVQGCLAWQKQGLGEPPEVADATDEYRSEMDALSKFLADSTIAGPREKALQGALYERYLDWAKLNGEPPLKRRDFDARVRERGVASRRGAGGWIVWMGFRLREPQDRFNKGK